MSFDINRLYELLPALYRIRDSEPGKGINATEINVSLENSSENPDDVIQGPLKSLLTVIAEQIAVIEENLDQLYDDQFIETCAEWVVPYIGDLVGARALISIPGLPFSQRGEVANTIGYRRRKGTVSVIEQLAADVTDWDANVVEYFQLLATTQYLNHLRPENLSFTSIRDVQKLEDIDAPFDKMAHTADVRRIEKNRGKYNIQNIGIFLWRLKSFTMTQSPACKVDEWRYTFDALGKDTQLYNKPFTEGEITHLAAPENITMPISRRMLHNNLETYYGVGKSILLYDNGRAILPDETDTSSEKPGALISVCNLADVYDGEGVLTGWNHRPNDKIAIDPELGRIAFPVTQPAPTAVRVTFQYAFSAELGAGAYARATYTKETLPVETVKGTIQEALDKVAHTGGIVLIVDNDYYYETPVIRVAAGKTIELRAADNTKPVLVPQSQILIEADENATVVLNGLLISGGGIHLPLKKADGQFNKLQLLRLEHSTLLAGPGPATDSLPSQSAAPSILVESTDTILQIEKTITGGIRVSNGPNVSINNSIVDAGEPTAVAYAGVAEEEPGGVLNISNSTVIGTVHTMIMEMASNCIFMASGTVSGSWPAPIVAQRLQQGCVRFSYIPPGSRLPRPYRCQPSGKPGSTSLQPVFTSLKYGDAGYCQLSQHCPAEIMEGADDEAEMGAFHFLHQPQRLANLRTRLREYLRFGLEAGIYYAS